MAGETPENPFKIDQEAHQFTPMASPEGIAEMNAAVKNIPPDQATALLPKIEKAMQEKKSANETINTIFGLIGGVVGVLKK